MRFVTFFVSIAVAASEPGCKVAVREGKTHVHVCTDSIFRVTHTPTDTLSPRVSLIVNNKWTGDVPFTVQRRSDVVTVQTSKVMVVLNRGTGLVSFFDASKVVGDPIVSEVLTQFNATQDMGKDTYIVEQQWSSSDDEALFGGGEFQNGFINFKNAPIQLVQFNTEAIVPFFTSSKGYGLLWDNYAWSYLNPADQALQFANNVAKFTPRKSGVHHFYIDACPGGFGCGDGKVLKLAVTEKTEMVVDWDNLKNLPNSMTGRAHLEAGRTYSISFSYTGWKTTPPVYVQNPDYGRTTLRSMVGDLVDYYFTWGGEAGMDGAIAGYRTITGAAPLYASWVYGFWQCREHYATQAELLKAAHGFRNRSIPVDSIVQDWLYWGGLGWGPQWDHKYYPDPAEMVKELKSINMQLMVSVWSKFDAKTSMFKTLTAQGQMLNGTQYYDAWNAAGREQFYQFSKTAHFDIGVDALWLDATEPEGFPNVNHNTALGTGNALMNSYSLMTTKAISDGLRRDFAEQQGARVFSLTRSSFAGQQSTGAALWSGDTSGAWDSLRRQVSASLNYQMSGIPYWSEDIGGFFRPGDQYTSADYRDMLVRWFQFGAFTPIYRVHGGGSHTEPWNYGDAVQKLINNTNNFRYRMLPYIYSGFHRVEVEGYTMQRALAMDFRNVSNVADQFMWGPALMVAPIVAQVDNVARQRQVIFPQTQGGWFNFWTGELMEGSGLAQPVPAPINYTPTYVRAGSILPLGPYLQYTGEKPADPLEVRIYPGADGNFTLFEDDGKSRKYQAGFFSTIDFMYADSRATLVIGERKGSFDGMQHNRTFNIVVVRNDTKERCHGVGLAPEESPDHKVMYVGSKITLLLAASAYAQSFYV